MKNQTTKQRIARYDFAILFLFLLIISIFIYINVSEEKVEEKGQTETVVNVHTECSKEKSDSLSILNIEELLVKTHMEHPHIVLAQIRLESGNLKSKLATENNNLLGMKYPYQRPTTSSGERNGYAYFDTWQDCIYDYLIWQSRYAKKLTEEEYYNYLESVYAQDEGYIKKLKQIANE